MFATRTTLRPLLPSGITYRTFARSCALRNTAADVHRSKEVGAAAETQDVTAMDALLRATRSKASPANQRLIPVRSRGKWQDTLRLHLSPSSPSTPATQPSTSTSKLPDLEPRRMSTSYSEVLLPFHSSSDLLEAYTNTSGGIRTGKLMEHLDNIAGSIAYKYMLGDGAGDGASEGKSVSELGYYIVTASVDRLDMLAPLYPVRDLRLSGQVIHVGRSSMEIVVRMEALEPGHTNDDAEGKTVMLGRFCMVCRDSKTHKARPVNPLVIESEEDRRLNAIGEAHKNRRHRHAIQSLARVPPSSEEAAALHALYLQSTTAPSMETDGKASIERVKMADTRVEKTLTMYPQERNVHQKIFGGYLMRLAYELGYTNSMLFTRGPVRFLSLDSIAFAKPVPIGSVLHLTSHILHTASTEQYPTLIHVGVKATVIDIKTGLEELTNDFRFTWSKEEGEPVERTVVPMTYQEAMWWIEGKRALDLGAEIRGIRQRQRV